MLMQMSLMVGASMNWMRLQRCLALWCQGWQVGFLRWKLLPLVEVAAPWLIAMLHRLPPLFR